LPDSGVHLFFLDELATFRLFNALSHSGPEAGVIFEEMQGCIFHQLLGVDALLLGGIPPRIVG